MDGSRLGDDVKRGYKKLRGIIKGVSDVFLYNPRDLYGCSYDKELPDYLIEHPGSVVYMGGGYDNNCLWIAYKKLFEKLKWLTDEQGVKVNYYKNLIFSPYGLRPKSDRVFSAKPPFQSWQKFHGDFHPEKVNYSDESDFTKRI